VKSISCTSRTDTVRDTRDRTQPLALAQRTPNAHDAVQRTRDARPRRLGPRHIIKSVSMVRNTHAPPVAKHIQAVKRAALAYNCHGAAYILHKPFRPTNHVRSCRPYRLLKRNDVIFVVCHWMESGYAQYAYPAYHRRRIYPWCSGSVAR
jgi:hypothetical protein